MSPAPLIAIPGRFSATASAHRFRVISTARALSEAVLRVGGEPLTVHPWAPEGVVTEEVVEGRLGFVDGVLMPGGGDVSPALYGQTVSSGLLYDVDDEQDAFDLAVVRWALAAGVPLLAVCRGFQLVNVALGGALEQDMREPHRHVVHQLKVKPGSRLARIVGEQVAVSCFHHQQVRALGDGLVPVAHASDGTVEAAELTSAVGWFLAVQWHPEDTFDSDEAQLSLFQALVEAARERTAQKAGLCGSSST